jgi:H/ACA ribonucleoprotein complex subunit 4
MKKVILPFEILLTFYKRIIVKSSSVNSICYGAKLITSGIIRAEKNIGKQDEVVLITIKGEAIALASSVINIAILNAQDCEAICITKQIIMKRDLYPKNWGIGIESTKKKLLKSSGFIFIEEKKKLKKFKHWNFK